MSRRGKSNLLFLKAIEKKKHVNDSVEAEREYVQAYIEYVHYVERFYSDAKAQGESQGHHDE